MERNDDGAVIRILDTGIGIEPRLLPHVFDLFVQGPASGRQTQAGSGVGLALVRALVNGHGGSVSAASAGTGTGSEFAVWLPVAREGQSASRRLTALRAGVLV
jgi:signal transduction histidine kinase